MAINLTAVILRKTPHPVFCVIIKDGLNLPASLHIIVSECWCFDRLTAGVKKSVKF
ncbi:hypothetical protein CAMRE0001_1870 [Campylobacter rectus RM3267]|uniref:Uncharacterized protein n=1 Tax=Campylobacter rectus RM3267 TaxID=553218 RepID=B9CYP1_CAMRE|nr:hypothetical protein CAMRE0001_1870 [Campylobacter rectus RM3267]